MSQSFGESYLSKVAQSEQEQDGPGKGPESDTTAKTATIAGDITLDQLREVVLALNGALLVAVPLLAWVLTGRSLRPVRQMYDQQRQFVSDASHELRTPLTIMKGEIDLALKRPRTSVEYRSALTAANGEVQRLQQLIENLLAIARSEDWRLEDFSEIVDMADSISRVIHRLQPMAHSKRIKLVASLPKTQLSVVGVATMLEQLIENIVANAIKFSPPASCVRIDCSRQEKWAIIHIRDNGQGMDNDTLKHVFDRFYREDSARNDQGFGLGLSICQAIVQQHHGTISVSSKLHKGTVVTVTLPADLQE